MNAIEKAVKALKYVAKNANCLPYDEEMFQLVGEALAALEAEKPSEDAREIARSIILSGCEFLNGLGGNKDEKILNNAIGYLQSFAESYHAKKCAECNAMIFLKSLKAKNVEPFSVNISLPEASK